MESSEFYLMLAKKNEAQAISDTLFGGRYTIHIVDTSPKIKGNFDIMAESLIDLTCKYFDLDVNKFKGNCRVRGYCDARSMYIAYVFMYWEKRVTLTGVGKTIRKNHATIIHSLKKHEGLMETCPEYNLKYVKYCELLNNC
jgi:chromosomal replication initiation ATPase DnaA